MAFSLLRTEPGDDLCGLAVGHNPPGFLASEFFVIRDLLSAETGSMSWTLGANRQLLIKDFRRVVLDVRGQRRQFVGFGAAPVLRRNQLAVAIVKHRNTNGYQPLTS